jgi:hypothetical protein
MQEKDANQMFPSTAATDVASLPAPLPAEAKRQAVHSISGTVYQAWCSIEAWTRLGHANQVIYLEGAEDFDLHENGNALTVQVRQTSSPISLGTEKARAALEHFWSLTLRSSPTVVEYHYMTTSAITREHDADFDGLAGIEAWMAAQTNEQFTAKLATYLVSKLSAVSELRTFLINADVRDVQQNLIQRFRWLTDRPDIDTVKQSVTGRICELLRHRRRSIGLATLVRNGLESYFWEVVIRKEAERRRLTLEDLHRVLDAAADPMVALSTVQLPKLLDPNNPGQILLKLLARDVPPVPSLLLKRRALCEQLTRLINQRKSILVTGTVGKGKTTLVQLVLGALDISSLWIDLAGADATWEKLLFPQLVDHMDDSKFPTVIVLDDLNLSPGRQSVYGTALADLLRRAESTGRSIVLTAQGESSASAAQQRFVGVEVVHVPEISIEEAKALCIDHGCPSEIADLWSVFVTAKTGGHPKLVQIQLDELTQRCWPVPQMSEMTSTSQGVASARQVTRQLLSDTVSTSDANLLYHASECLVLLHRSVLIRLAELVENGENAGDVIDRFAGRWIECIEGEWYRTTALLSGAAKDVWSDVDQAKAHARLHAAILHKSPLSPAEAGALLYHAYFSKDEGRLAHTALKLQTIDSREARQEVEQRYLLWLPYLATGPGQRISNNPYTAVILRALQFGVATAIDADVVPNICDRWVEDLEAVDGEALQSVFKAHLWLAIGFSECEKVPLTHRLAAATGLLTLQGEPKRIADIALATIFDNPAEAADFPRTATPSQFVLLSISRSIDGIAGIETLLSWLNSTNDASRSQFEDVMGWYITQTLGAFVQGAWSRNLETVEDWLPWIAVLDRVDACAKRWGLSRFGREAAKAKAIILSEYLSDVDTAVACLQQAEVAFGPSGVLLEQRANICYRQHQDEDVLQIWRKLSQSEFADVFFDPFAARRSGISAGRLERWQDAQEIFQSAASRLRSDSLPRIRFGLTVDAALAASNAGNQIGSSLLLAEAVVALPSEAAGEGDPQWEAVQRIAVGVCRLIEYRVGHAQGQAQSIELGTASASSVSNLEANPGQALRTALTQAQALRLAASLGIWPTGADACLATLDRSRQLLVRLVVSETQLSLAYAQRAGDGFIPSLLQFYKSLHLMMIHRHEGPGYEIDHTEWDQPVTLPDTWFGYLIAGMLCSGHALLDHLACWLSEARRCDGDETPLYRAIGRLLEGASQSGDDVARAVRTIGEDGFIRLGAATTWMLDRPSADQLFELQQLAVYPLVSDFVKVRQDLFNQHVAKVLANAWQDHATSGQFQFVSPRTTVPVLMKAIEATRQGHGSIQTILQAAANALGKSMHPLLRRLA